MLICYLLWSSYFTGPRDRGLGELVAAEVAHDMQYDPGNERVRS
jgi:hypothetical protein